MEYFLPKMLQTLRTGIENWFKLKNWELEYFILCVSGRILNYEQKFSNTIKRNQ